MTTYHWLAHKLGNIKDSQHISVAILWGENAIGYERPYTTSIEYASQFDVSANFAYEVVREKDTYKKETYPACARHGTKLHFMNECELCELRARITALETRM